MYVIKKKKQWSEKVFTCWIDAPWVARSASPGQFLVTINSCKGERIPMTIVDVDGDSIELLFQVVGKSTLELSRMNEGDSLYAVVGPLGNPSVLQKFDGPAVFVAGGIGVGPIYPIAKKAKEMGNKVISIMGSRSETLLVMTDQMREISDELLISTDDGSCGRKGFVTDLLREVLERDEKPSHIWAIGPAIMMKFVALTAKPFNVPLTVSLNPIMVDATGMCGVCRVYVNGENKLACVDGPEFDGYAVDYDGFMGRLTQYQEKEAVALKHYMELEG
ncbi:MAG: sulfide/dihydroorotate dehydrogenase-like FAD/NAD-binding protein [Epsilonproteobacteria bacterium]|nr:sulfide/dihydroorotate dehydrogenase-like FAD/NAD-binding protein [Campylobacterota bacterium]